MDCSAHCVKVVTTNTNLLARASAGAAGYDLYAAESVVIAPGSSRKVTTGLRVEMDGGMFAMVLGRSGLALKNNVIAHNGTIDSDYRGEICVLLFILSLSNTFEVAKGDRVAQLVFVPLLTPELVSVQRLSETSRGSKGFGSTGINALE